MTYMWRVSPFFTNLMLFLSLFQNNKYLQFLFTFCVELAKNHFFFFSGKHVAGLFTDKTQGFGSQKLLNS